MKIKSTILILMLAAWTAVSGCGAASGNTEKTPAATVIEEKEEATQIIVTDSDGQADPSAKQVEKEHQKPIKNLKEAAGTYHLTGMTAAGEVTSTEDFATLEKLGMNMYLVLKGDGTGILKTQEEASIKWDKKSIYMDGRSASYIWYPTGRKIVLTQDDEELVFTVLTARELLDAGLGTEGDSSEMSEILEEMRKEQADPAECVDFEMAGADWVNISETAEGQLKGLCIWYDFTNKTDHYMAPYSLVVRASQDGKELAEGTVYTAYDKPVAEEAYRYSAIRPGVTNRCIHLLGADPDGGKIEYKVCFGYLSEDPVFETTLDPKKLPGKPAKAFDRKKIETIDWLEDIPESGAYADNFDITIKKSEIRESEGTRYIRVWIDFKNSSDDSASFFTAVSLRAVQDGIELSPGWSSYEDAALVRIYENVSAGKTLEVCKEWALRTDSPVAVELFDYWDESILLGKPFNVK